MSAPLNVEAYALQIFAANVAFWLAICRPAFKLRTRKQWLFDTTALPRIMYRP